MVDFDDRDSRASRKSRPSRDGETVDAAGFFDEPTSENGHHAENGDGDVDPQR